MTDQYYDQIQESTAYINATIKDKPDVAIVLGTGLGNLVKHIEVEHVIAYEDIPHFPPVTVKGHEGQLVYGSLNGKKVIAQNGRYHYYEGYSMKEVTLPIRVFKFLGAQHLVIASAVGGIHEDYEAGDITVVNDHINLHYDNPLLGHYDERLGPRFPDMVDAYDPVLIKLCHEIAGEQGTTLHDSVYGGLPGPNLETKAEYNYLHIIGATVVGMSTIPEILVARHMELSSCVLTAVTNKCFPISAIKKVTHQEVIDVAEKVEQKITPLVSELIKRL